MLTENMPTVIDGLRQILGKPEFYVEGVLDYGAVFEYFVGAVILCLVVCSVFKLIKEAWR